MATLLDLANELDELSIVIKLRALELTKFVSLRMLEYLLRVTPVDTSKAISNYVVSPSGSSFGAPVLPPHVPGTQGSTRSASAAETMASARMALRYAQPGKAIAIINAAPYIKRLNEGWSDQHPGGFIEASILVGKRAVREYNLNKKIRRGRPKGEL